ncbi:MAG: tRNA (adenosine(37)-N6)-threonylcarbamoyltransferase complex ATPase subunit type 1 TsaE [Desulfobacteraceae bacterium]|jgi:tRNA threonylcarbamoyladenosine biosynthesis protein TsaE
MPCKGVIFFFQKFIDVIIAYGYCPLKIEDFTVITDSDQQTIKFGQRLGAFLEKADVVALAGELGSGKTWLAKGIALGLGVNPSTVVTSPSFALVNEYEGRLTLFHMDIYRLESLSELLSAGLEEYLYSGGVVVLEWADRWPEILPDQTIKVELLILSDNRRQITLSGRHPRVMEIIDAVKQDMAA